MKRIDEKKHLIAKIESAETQDPLPGYPLYPTSEDIYSRCKEEEEEEEEEKNPEEIEQKKNLDRSVGFEEFNVKDFENHMSGNDL